MDVDSSTHGETEALWVSDFEGFYRTERDRLYRVLAVALRDPDLAAESIDEAFARAYARWDEVRFARSPAGWVYRVAHNWAIDRLRQRRRALRHPFERPEPVWNPEVPDEQLTKALNDLPVAQRSVVVLRILLDWSERDVAEVLGIAEGTVKSRLARALERLRRVVT